LMAVRALAVHEGVDDALLAEWAHSQPDLPRRSEDAVRASTRKAWRFVGEMEEIAVTFAEAGLPVGFHEAAAEVYRRLAGRANGRSAGSEFGRGRRCETGGEREASRALGRVSWTVEAGSADSVGQSGRGRRVRRLGFTTQIPGKGRARLASVQRVYGSRGEGQ